MRAARNIKKLIEIHEWFNTHNHHFVGSMNPETVNLLEFNHVVSTAYHWVGRFLCKTLSIIGNYYNIEPLPIKIYLIYLSLEWHSWLLKLSDRSLQKHPSTFLKKHFWCLSKFFENLTVKTCLRHYTAFYATKEHIAILMYLYFYNNLKTRKNATLLHMRHHMFHTFEVHAFNAWSLYRLI